MIIYTNNTSFYYYPDKGISSFIVYAQLTIYSWEYTNMVNPWFNSTRLMLFWGMSKTFVIEPIFYLIWDLLVDYKATIQQKIIKTGLCA